MVTEERLYAYDHAERLLSEHVVRDGVTSHVLTNAYDELGRPVSVRYGNGDSGASIAPGLPDLMADDGHDGDGISSRASLGDIIIIERPSSMTTRDYCGNRIYVDGRLERTINPHGYTDSLGNDFFYIRDYLGNVRSVIDASGNLVEVNDYYPYGALMNTLADNPSQQPYKYGAKELDRTAGLDLYDSQARQYDPLLGRTTTVDPHSSAYFPTSHYAWCAGNPVRNIDPDGMDGVRIIDDESQTITVKANYYVDTQSFEYRDQHGRIKKAEPYSAEDIIEMNSYDDFLNQLNLKVPSGEYEGYIVLFELTFLDGGNIAEATAKASEDKYKGHPIGNTIQLADEKSYTHLNFKAQIYPDGTTRMVGGVTDKNKAIVMNKPVDSRMNRIHEIFHTFGFSHPKSGGSQGIMKYPPSKPTQIDALEISLSNFLPVIKK